MPIFISAESGEFQSILDWVQGRREPSPERYLRGMAILELLWRQAVPGLSFQVVHDEPEQLPGAATRIAMEVFAALQENPVAHKWFVRHIRNAVVHCTTGVDAIAVVGDSIHFYQVKDFSGDLGERLFDQLSQRQKQDLDELHTGVDPRQEFAAFVNSIAITHPDEAHVRRLYEQVRQSLLSNRCTLLVTKAMESENSGSGDCLNDGEWSDELDERRIELIDKDIQGNITTEECVELAELQRRAIAYRDRLAPLPIEGARRLHGLLMEMKGQREGSG